mmetsp:Transcript_25710/g.45102  ORF Transcript_25710/g.45102 Transcript_25710/m.45102 type:complete len:123 (-) Transcript_25710:2977-3345(-)
MEGVKTRFMSAAQMCGVCWQNVAQQGELDCCKHVFCLECVLRWARQAGTCPICKGHISTVTARWLRKCLSENPVEPAVYEVAQVQQREINFEVGSRHYSLIFYVSSAIGNVEAMISRLFEME